MLGKPLDLGAIGIALGVTIISAVLSYAGSPAQIILQGGRVQWVFPLDQEEQISVPGPLGNTVVELRDRKARILISPCDNQTCVAAGAIHSRGQWIACLPNQVLVSIEGKALAKDTADGLDASAW